MKAMKKLVYIILASFGFIACEKIVEVDLPTEPPRLVVEGQITNQNSLWQIRLTLSQPYFDQEASKSVSDAVVRIMGTDGSDVLLNHRDTGVYVSADNHQCIVGETYTLTVDYNGESYTASERLKNAFELDTLADFFLPPDVSFFPSGIYVFIQGQTDSTQDNYYIFKTYRNDSLISEDLDDDLFGSVSLLNSFFDVNDIPGELARGLLPRPILTEVKDGDSVRVEQFAVSEKYYEYIADLNIQQSRSGSPFDPPPANPSNNVGNGAVGYFSVAHKAEKKLVIKE